MVVKGAPARADSHIAVVCGGGGITGGVFEVGALRALDEALGGGVVNNADTYAGASAGALIATLLAAGLTPREMEQVIVRGARNRRRLPALKRTSVYGIDRRAWLTSAARLPWVMARGFATSLLPGDQTGIADALFEGMGALPSGIFTNAPLASFVEEILRQLGQPLSFAEFHKQLLITAVNVDTGHRVVFGAAGARDIPIPSAVQASAAVPLMFRPVRIDDQDFIDGGVERNLPVDVAIDAGAHLIIAINPLVPVVNDPRSEDSLNHGFRYLSDRGLPAVADQVFRMLVRSQVLYGLKSVRERFPEVDIVLIEPEAHDWTMFSYHPMRYSVRSGLAQHAYDMTRSRLARDEERLQHVFARHGLDFDARRMGKPAGAREARKRSRLVRLFDLLPGGRGGGDLI
jgi:NTE family protein